MFWWRSKLCIPIYDIEDITSMHPKGNRTGTYMIHAYIFFTQTNYMHTYTRIFRQQNTYSHILYVCMYMLHSLLLLFSSQESCCNLQHQHLNFTLVFLKVVHACCEYIFVNLIFTVKIKWLFCNQKEKRKCFVCWFD